MAWNKGHFETREQSTLAFRQAKQKQEEVNPEHCA